MHKTVSQRRQAIANRHPEWEEMCLNKYLERSLLHFSDEPLVITDEVSLDYKSIFSQSERLAKGLTGFGISQGDRVGLLMANYPVTVSLLFAIWRVGAVAVAINTLYNVSELEHVVRESGCNLIISMAKFGSRRFDTELDSHMPGWRDGDCASFPELRGGMVYDADNPDKFFSAMPSTELPTQITSPHDPAVIMFTSGTTGAPKGVIQTHDNLLRAAYAGAVSYTHLRAHET